MDSMAERTESMLQQFEYSPVNDAVADPVRDLMTRFRFLARVLVAEVPNGWERREALGHLLNARDLAVSAKLYPG